MVGSKYLFAGTYFPRSTTGRFLKKVNLDINPTWECTSLQDVPIVYKIQGGKVGRIHPTRSLP